MVREIPPDIGKNDDTIMNFFFQLYGDKVVYAKMIPRVGDLNLKRKVNVI